MKVFINKRTALYSGGIIIVAANTIEEAQSVLLTTFPDTTYMYDIDGDQCFDPEDSAYEENWYYKKENWEELPGITADFEVPTFITENGYSE